MAKGLAGIDALESQAVEAVPGGRGEKGAGLMLARVGAGRQSMVLLPLGACSRWLTACVG